MYARVVSAQADPRRVEAYDELRQLGVALAEHAAEQPGNLGFVGLLDRSTGKVMTVSFWETPQALAESELNAYLRRQLAFASCVIGSPVVCETFEVVAQTGLVEIAEAVPAGVA